MIGGFKYEASPTMLLIIKGRRKTLRASPTIFMKIMDIAVFHVAWPKFG